MEIVETEDGNCYVSQSHALFCEESLGKIDAEMSNFPGTGRSTIFYCMKSLITFEQVNASVKTSI